MRVIIVDDEVEILQDIKNTIQEHEGFEVVGAYTNPLMVLGELNHTKPECAFLDIEMPGMNGIDLAEKLLSINPHMEVVFITAFNHYATQAFDVNAIDYVLKPVSPKRFEKTIERLRRKPESTTMPDKTEIFIHSLGYFEILLDGISIKWNRSKAKELLAYLIHYKGYKKTKYVICEDLWPEFEPKKALVNLQTAMCSLRKSLGEIGREAIKIEFLEESYRLTLGNAEWDADLFEQLYASVRKNKDEAMIEKAISLYQGEYMGSEDWNWSMLTTESLTRKHAELVKNYGDICFKNGMFDKTVKILIDFVKHEAPDREVQLMLMEAAFCQSGIAGLNYSFNSLRDILQNEHGADVAPEVMQYCIQKGIKV